MSGERRVRQRPECLIIAAGKGSRLSALGEPKPLVPFRGRPLIAWVMRAAARGGVGGFSVVTGYLGETLRGALEGATPVPELPLRFIENPDWERPNGLSVACAEAAIRGPFVLLMSDHLFDGAILERLLAEPIADDEVVLAVDRRVADHPTADLDDVTRVLTRDGRIVAIGKGIPEYDAFDTGIFLCSPALFAALRESFAAGDHSLSGGIRALAARGRARAFDVGDGLWIDVDDEAAYERAERLFPDPPAAGPRRAPGYAVERLDDELLLFNPANASVIALNPTAALVWDLCDGTRSLEQIGSLIAGAYPEAAAEIPGDVAEIVALFARHGAVEAGT